MESYNIPDAVKSRHNTNEQLQMQLVQFHFYGNRATHHHESQRLSMFDKPTSHKQPNSQENSHNCKPVPSCPPQSKQKAYAQHYARNLACDNIEPAKYKERTDERRSEITCWQCNSADSSLHVCNSSFTWVERDRFNPSSCAAGCYGMAEFVKCDNEHLYESIG